MKRALITGVTGQDGSYLADLLLDKGYEVHGVLRRSSSPSTARIEHINGGASGARLLLHYADLSYTEGLVALLRKIEPHEIYHLAAQSHVGFSFDMPELTGDVRFAELAAIMVDADLEAAGLRPAGRSGAAAGGRRVD